ncbi:hypothetical protein U0070_027723, partial [Myodes glareolus]
ARFTHQHYVHTHPLHCDPDRVSPAHLLPVATSEEHAVQCPRLQRCQHCSPHEGSSNGGHLPVT